jgi:hypothetical protein
VRIRSSGKVLLITGIALLTLSSDAARADEPAMSCCEVCHKVCVPTIEKTKKTKVVYGCKVKDFCLPKCSSNWHGCCDCLQCGKPRTKRVLLKRSISSEECVPRCKVQHVVESVPACECERSWWPPAWWKRW